MQMAQSPFPLTWPTPVRVAAKRSFSFTFGTWSRRLLLPASVWCGSPKSTCSPGQAKHSRLPLTPMICLTPVPTTNQLSSPEISRYLLEICRQDLLCHVDKPVVATKAWGESRAFVFSRQWLKPQPHGCSPLRLSSVSAAGGSSASQQSQRSGLPALYGFLLNSWTLRLQPTAMWHRQPPQPRTSIPRRSDEFQNHESFAQSGWGMPMPMQSQPRQIP